MDDLGGKMTSSVAARTGVSDQTVVSEAFERACTSAVNEPLARAIVPSDRGIMSARAIAGAE